MTIQLQFAAFGSMLQVSQLRGDSRQVLEPEARERDIWRVGEWLQQAARLHHDGGAIFNWWAAFPAGAWLPYSVLVEQRMAGQLLVLYVNDVALELEETPVRQPLALTQRCQLLLDLYARIAAVAAFIDTPAVRHMFSVVTIRAFDALRIVLGAGGSTYDSADRLVLGRRAPPRFTFTVRASFAREATVLWERTVQQWAATPPPIPAIQTAAENRVRALRFDNQRNAILLPCPERESGGGGDALAIQLLQTTPIQAVYVDDSQIFISHDLALLPLLAQPLQANPTPLTAVIVRDRMKLRAALAGYDRNLIGYVPFGASEWTASALRLLLAVPEHAAEIDPVEPCGILVYGDRRDLRAQPWLEVLDDMAGSVSAAQRYLSLAMMYDPEVVEPTMSVLMRAHGVLSPASRHDKPRWGVFEQPLSVLESLAGRLALPNGQAEIDLLNLPVRPRYTLRLWHQSGIWGPDAGAASSTTPTSTKLLPMFWEWPGGWLARLSASKTPAAHTWPGALTASTTNTSTQGSADSAPLHAGSTLKSSTFCNSMPVRPRQPGSPPTKRQWQTS